MIDRRVSREGIIPGPHIRFDIVDGHIFFRASLAGLVECYVFGFDYIPVGSVMSIRVFIFGQANNEY